MQGMLGLALGWLHAQQQRTGAVPQTQKPPCVLQLAACSSSDSISFACASPAKYNCKTYIYMQLSIYEVLISQRNLLRCNLLVRPCPHRTQAQTSKITAIVSAASSKMLNHSHIFPLTQLQPIKY